MAPRAAFGPDGMEDAGRRVAALFVDACVPVDPSVWKEGPGPGRDALATALREAIDARVEQDIEISSDELFVLHRRKDQRDLFFVINPTFEEVSAQIRLPGSVDAVVWDPTTGRERSVRTSLNDGRSEFAIVLPPVGSAFVLPTEAEKRDPDGDEFRHAAEVVAATLDGSWTFQAEAPNALVIQRWLATPETDE